MVAPQQRQTKAGAGGAADPSLIGSGGGTSGKRGAFLVSDDEQARWAGTILAKLLPQGLLHKERIAFLLRANNNLYNAVRSPTISFEFFEFFWI